MGFPSPVELCKDDPWLIAKLAGEKEPSNRILVPPTLVKPSPILLPAIAAFKEIKKDKAAAASGRATKKPVVSASDPFFRLPRTVLSTFRVTVDVADRAILLIDTLIKACEARGLDVFHEGRELRVGFAGHSARIRLSERVDTVRGPAAGLSDFDLMLKRNVRYVSTDSLSLFVERLATERKLQDKPDLPLEDQLNTAMGFIFRAIAETRAWREFFEREISASKAAQVAAEAQRQQERLAKEVREQAMARLVEREQGLAAEARAWREAQLIRAYLDHLHKSGAEVGADLSRWLSWASEVAERLDPTQRRVASADSAEADL